MKHARLSAMHRGWFVGDFAPTAYATPDCEVGVKRYRAGDVEAAHVHKIATELTVVVSGRVRMNGREFVADDIIVLDPGVPSDFEVLDDTVTVVVKVPCVAGDKYPFPESGAST
jgi:hypothetical protein